MNSVNDFQATLRKFGKIMGLNQATLVRYIALDLLSKIVMRTPVDTGRARSGWDMTIGTPSEYVPPKVQKTESVGSIDASAANNQSQTQDQNALNLDQTLGVFLGGASFSAQRNAALIDGTQSVFIINNLPYIERLEHGWSKQAPAGMVRISKAEVEARIELTVQKLFPGEN